MLPVVIVGGLHADARRTVVETLLRAVPTGAALHHDLSTATGGSVTRTVRDAHGVLDRGEAPLVNNCPCCALREDLLPEVERLAAGGLCRLAVVELWDSVEPESVVDVITRHAGEGISLVGVVTAVDPALVLPYLANGDDLADVGLAAARGDRRTVGDTSARQLEYATVLALVDGGETADASDHALLSQLHPTARTVGVTVPEALLRAATAGFDATAAAARLHPATALLPQERDERGVTTYVWRSRRPFHPGRLYAALEDLACAAVRSRGRFWLADRPGTLLSWDAAGGALCVNDAGLWLVASPDEAWQRVPAARRAAAALDWHPEHGDREQHLVFVSPGLDTDGLATVLESCLLTEAEYAAGPGSWARIGSGFDRLLTPVP
ncbi:GTP-binding protein [Streptomyces sp. RFCAC02]|uniref:CobW family GTP-binding protein n=1 Tax=Streptomyces sp. RFCAC02 TaxID=2499143 RepID=UPI00102034FF|nr:GTP-binding protein [Streptomyces sp. RFCAC02]